MNVPAEYEIKLLIFHKLQNLFLSEKPVPHPQNRMFFDHRIVGNQNFRCFEIAFTSFNDKVP